MHLHTGGSKDVEPQVVIVILNWNGKEDTLACLASLRHVAYDRYEVLVVDNGSTDGSVAGVRNQFPHVSVIETGENLGFAAGNNVGIRWALGHGADYVCLLNNDTVVDGGFLDELVQVAQRANDIGFAGPKIYFYTYKGRKDVIAFAGGAFRIARGNAGVGYVGARTVDRGQYDTVRDVDYVEGSCMLVRRDVIERIGVLNPVYFLYWEDVEWCLRGAEAGYRSVYVPTARIWHKIGARAEATRSTSYYYFGRNLIWLVKQHASRAQSWAFALSFYCFGLWRIVLTSLVLHRNVAEVRALLRGIRHGRQTAPPTEGLVRTERESSTDRKLP